MAFLNSFDFAIVSSQYRDRKFLYNNLEVKVSYLHIFWKYWKTNAYLGVKFNSKLNGFLSVSFLKVSEEE